MNDDASPLVLVVDDDEAMRRSMAFLFSSVGLESKTFATGEDFLAAYPVGNELRPGCIMLDVRMPGMSGLELQRRLIEQRCDLPIVIVTGHGDVQMAVGALKSGAYNFIEKPFKEQNLLDLVAEAIKVSRQRLAASAARRSIEERLARLGKREHEVLERVLAGKPNKISSIHPLC